MTTTEKINNLLKARNLLHAQEEGKEVTSLDITMAHDIIDIVVDDLVDEEFHKSMEAARKGMEPPQIQICDTASPKQVELIANINWLLNGSEHMLETSLFAKMENGSVVCVSKVEYVNNTLWVVEYKNGNPECMYRLDRMCAPDLGELYGQLINEII